jgi:hypothetical protein
MKIIRTRVSYNFLTEALLNKVDFSDGELPTDAKVTRVECKPGEPWVWLYFESDDFVDIDLSVEPVPELTLWFGSRR